MKEVRRFLSFCEEPKKEEHLLLWSRYRADILCPAQCLWAAAQELSRGRGPLCS